MMNWIEEYNEIDEEFVDYINTNFENEEFEVDEYDWMNF